MRSISFQTTQLDVYTWTSFDDDAPLESIASGFLQPEGHMWKDSVG